MLTSADDSPNPLVAKGPNNQAPQINSPDPSLVYTVSSNVSNLAIKGNEIHDMRSDGMCFANVRNVAIEANTIHDFNPSYLS